ncbi:MAG: cysteine synthase A, partial [bacterium]
MLDEAERQGLLGPGSVVIEPTSGNTGIGLAAVAAVRGYRAIIVMPDSMSRERRVLMSAYGAELVLTPGEKGMAGAIARAEELRRSIPGAVVAGQFTNPANPAAHYKTTGPEIWRDTGGAVDAFVAGIGTGGTITGAGRYLRERNPAIRLIGVEPAASPWLTEGRAGAHKLQGIGAGFTPAVLDITLLDEILPVPDEAAMETGRQLGKLEGFLAGISSGAALRAAIEVAQREEMAGKTVVALLPDTGDRYLSTELFAD